MKSLKKELMIYAALLLALSAVLHPERLSLLDSSNWWHPFLYTFFVYALLAVVRLIVGWAIGIVRRFDAKI